MKDPITATACALLEKQRPFIVATIITQEGSAPRTAGTKMLISAETCVGTIGGGSLEAKVTTAAVDLLSEARPARLMPFDLTRDDTTAMDMICGGRGAVLLDRFPASAASLALFQQWRRLQEERRPGWFLTIHTDTGGGEEIASVTHCVLGGSEEIWEGPPLPGAARQALAAAAERTTALKVIETDGLQGVIEPALSPTTVYFFGAGHVAQPSLHLAALTGFRTEIVDDRADFSNRERFPEADRIHVIDDFSNACTDLALDATSFIVIFTRGHHHDRIVLAQALRTEAAYIGMIGSRRKRDAIFAALEKEGFTPSDLVRVHSPIGLDIGAETPEEIAVSIVAELIQERARLQP
jgi:xanthine dehydrogenase accessory factor